MDENGVIGHEGGMPWHLPNDLRHFKSVTLEKPILMGRRTHESIGRALPKRENLILSRDSGYQAEGCHTVTSIEQGCERVRERAQELMVIGGAQIYQLALPIAHRIYLTRIHAAFEGDTWFPSFEQNDWKEVSQERHSADEKNPHAHSFIELHRRD